MSPTIEAPPRATESVLDDSRDSFGRVDLQGPRESGRESTPGEDVLARANRMMKDQFGPRTIQRTALLGIVLASFDGVPFEQVAELLDVKPPRLVKMMHGDESVPQRYVPRWEALAEILQNLHGVLKPDATARWLNTDIPDLNGRTPIDLIKRGKVEPVLRLTRSYLDQSFA